MLLLLLLLLLRWHRRRRRIERERDGAAGDDAARGTGAAAAAAAAATDSGREGHGGQRSRGGERVGGRVAEVELELELLVDDEYVRLEAGEARQGALQLPHVVLGHLPAQDGVADAGVDAVRRAQGQAVDVVAHQRDLAHEVQGAVQALDQQIGLQQQHVAGQVDVFGGAAQRQRLVVPEHEIARLAAHGRQRRRRLREHVGEHQAVLRRRLLLGVGRVQHLVYPRLRERVLPYHGPDLGREGREVAKVLRLVVVVV